MILINLFIWFRPNAPKAHRILDAKNEGETAGSLLAHERHIRNFIDDLDVKTLYMYVCLNREAKKLYHEKQGRYADGSPYGPLEREGERLRKGEDPLSRLIDHYFCEKVIPRPWPRPDIPRGPGRIKLNPSSYLRFFFILTSLM